MGTIIKSVGVAKPFFRKRILPLAVMSVKQCLRIAGIDSRKIGLLVNTSLYSENHLGEPALASLIQKKIQMTRFPKNPDLFDSEKMFSFDLKCGGNGLNHAFQLIDSFLQTGEIEYGLVVAGDVRPVSGTTENFNYSQGAAAVLLSKTEENRGFDYFRSDTFPEFLTDLESSIDWSSGKFKFAIQQKKVYLKNCISCALIAVNRFFKEKDTSWDEIDLVITSQNPVGFAEMLKKEAGLKSKIFELPESNNFHSAGLLFSISKVFNSQRFQEAKNILFITVGAGINVTISLYKN
jgi:3-oxoacyl-[acyl-carrier-protein] synthase-3